MNITQVLLLIIKVRKTSGYASDHITDHHILRNYVQKPSWLDKMKTKLRSRLSQTGSSHALNAH